jgi:hypothetical protein
VEEKLPRLHSLSGWHPHSTARSPPPQSKLNPLTATMRYAIATAHLHFCLTRRTTIHRAAYAHLAVSCHTATKAIVYGHHATTTARAHCHCRRHRARSPNLAIEHVASSGRLCMEEEGAAASNASL